MRQILLGDDDAQVHRMHFLRAVGLVGAGAVGLAALEPSDAFAFTTKELEEGLHLIGEAKLTIAIGSELAHNTGEYNTAVGIGALKGEHRRRKKHILPSGFPARSRSGKLDLIKGSKRFLLLFPLCPQLGADQPYDLDASTATDSLSTLFSALKASS